MPFHSLKMFSIDSDAQPLVSEQTSSSLEEVWLGHDDSMDEPNQFLLQSQDGFDWHDKICTVLHSNSRHFTPTHCSKSMKGRTIPGVVGIVGFPNDKSKRAPSPPELTETLRAMILVSHDD